MQQGTRDVWPAFLNRSLRNFLPPDFPEIVTLCGSTRFKDAFIEAARRLTLEGKIVISVGMFGHQEGIDMSGPVKAGLDELHKRKIDLADEILVLNCKRWCCSKCDTFADDTGTLVCNTNGSDCRPHPWADRATGEMRPYIGSSTRSEIEYAQAHGKVIRYLEPIQ